MSDERDAGPDDQLLARCDEKEQHVGQSLGCFARIAEELEDGEQEKKRTDDGQDREDQRVKTSSKSRAEEGS